MRASLAKELRKQLEKTVIKARDIAELAAREELQRLSVGDKAPADYLSGEQRQLRKRLRAHGRQRGDFRKPEGSKGAGEQGIEQLVSEVAYEHWHRMLFARFLAESNLLMYDDGVTPLAIEDCFDLAEEETGDRGNGWQYAAKYAATMLPQIFRTDSPVFELELATNHQKQLELLLANLMPETFQATDSLGWVYQFWQSKKKEKVNASGDKVGADEVSAVTQLFTESYMVDYLMDNSLGSWWVSHHSDKDIPLEFPYLRLSEDGTPVGGGFPTWPNDLGNFKTLDPCCGSGHFLVAIFLMLVPMRMVLERLSVDDAVDAVLRDNIHGLELDNRCVEIAAFALALEAWRFPGCSGFRPLPEIKVAWVGQSIRLKRDEWLGLAEGSDRVERAMSTLYDLFSDAPLLGSLIDPKYITSKDLISAGWDEVEEIIRVAFDKIDLSNEDTIEAVNAAKGISYSLKLLTQEYMLVATNPPYLVRGKQAPRLQKFSLAYYPAGSADIATVFFKRIKNFLSRGGVHLAVTPLNWLFIKSYKELRSDLINNDLVNHVSKIGSGATAKESWDVLRALTIVTCTKPMDDSVIYGIEAITTDEEGRAFELKANDVSSATVSEVRGAPDCRFVLDLGDVSTLIEDKAGSYQGLATADYPCYGRKFWEVREFRSTWEFQHSTFKESESFSGLEHILRWECGEGSLSISSSARIQGLDAHGLPGVVVTQTRQLPSTRYLGGFFDNNVAVIVPSDEKDLPALWCYTESEEYHKNVRKIDEKLGVTNATLAKVPFDLPRWSKLADEKYPNGLPKPYSDDPVQWISHGHPCGSVIWDESAKNTVIGELRMDDTVLHVAVARLLGYQWPSERDADMELADDQRRWVDECKSLAGFVDDDGIACMSAVRGEKPAHERLELFLQDVYGNQWSSSVRNKLLEAVGCSNKSLDFWLREKFFEQHFKLFQHRPFIWHIWDGLKDGFSALLNYHQLDQKNLERLIYTYLDDWIRTQKHQQAENIDGAAERLAAAEGLKQQLERILQGEAPYDIFVRWKPLDQQAIGWQPDLNDGVRLNIRPFLSADDVGKKGAGVLRAKPNIHWKKDRGKDVASAPWYTLGLEYDGKEGDRINDHHLTLKEKQMAGECITEGK